jgi:hypothetical protein
MRHITIVAALLAARKHRLFSALFALFAFFVVFRATPAFAQGATSGSINGTVTDNTGAVLPGVTVSVSGPALMGTQAAHTSDQGQYRFPALPPGAYRLSYELTGFTTVIRADILVSIGFTATVNVQLNLASLQESVTVLGASPVVDIQNTNIQNNFSSELLKSIPNARDLWALIAVAPGTTMSRFDVGGSAAGTQTGYTAYGLSSQVRVQVDGVNATEDTGGTGYFDYGAFEEVQIGTDSNDASMPTPGVQLNAVLKSGGNNFKGEVYTDYESESLQARNVDDRLLRLGVGEGTRITSYYDPNVNVGGPFKRDKFWYFVSFRNQHIGTTVTGFPVDKPGDFEFLTRLTNLTYKLSYQFNANNRVSHYIQARQKLQPFRDAASTRYTDSVFRQDSVSIYGGSEWHSIVNPRFFFNTRFSSWGYNWPNFQYGDDGVINGNVQFRRIERATNNQSGGAYADRTYRRRWQFDWNGTLFKDDWLGGNHAIKLGYVNEREIERDTLDGYRDEIRMRFDSPSAGPDFVVPWRVELYNTPTTPSDLQFHQGAYVHDQFVLGRGVTLNLGVRWDAYRVGYPDEEKQASRFRDFFYAGAPLPNGYRIPAAYPDFRIPARKNVMEYDAAFGPRFGIAWSPRGAGKTVMKANWGRYYHNPGPRGDQNPLQEVFYTFTWIDRNSDRLFTLDELGNFVSSSGGVTNTVNPNIGHPYTDDVSLWLEQQIASGVSGRVGFVSKRQRNLYQSIEQNRVRSLYTGSVRPFDAGPDGLRGTADDVGELTVFDIPAGVTVPPGRTDLQTPDENFRDYKSVDVTLNKRMANRWSLVTSFLYTWTDDSLYGRPENPNQDRYNRYDSGLWAFKLFGTYRAPWNVMVSPVVRHQAGDSLRRILEVTLRTGTFNYTADPFGTYREDNVTLFDTRVEKEFRMPSRRRLGLFFDAFNITNSNAAQALDNVTGRRTTTVNGASVEYQRFLRPTVVLAPRVYRFGIKMDF